MHSVAYILWIGGLNDVTKVPHRVPPNKTSVMPLSSELILSAVSILSAMLTLSAALTLSASSILSTAKVLSSTSIFWCIDPLLWWSSPPRRSYLPRRSSPPCQFSDASILRCINPHRSVDPLHSIDLLHYIDHPHWVDVLYCQLSFLEHRWRLGVDDQFPSRWLSAKRLDEPFLLCWQPTDCWWSDEYSCGVNSLNSSTLMIWCSIDHNPYKDPVPAFRRSIKDRQSLWCSMPLRWSQGLPRWSRWRHIKLRQ